MSLKRLDASSRRGRRAIEALLERGGVRLDRKLARVQKKARGIVEAVREGGDRALLRPCCDAPRTWGSATCHQPRASRVLAASRPREGGGVLRVVEDERARLVDRQGAGARRRVGNVARVQGTRAETVIAVGHPATVIERAAPPRVLASHFVSARGPLWASRVLRRAAGVTYCRKTGAGAAILPRIAGEGDAHFLQYVTNGRPSGA